MAAISLNPRARHRCPTDSAECHSRRKCTVSKVKSVVTSTSFPEAGRRIAQSSPMPMVTGENEGAVTSRRPREGLRFSPREWANRLRNASIKARSPLLDNCRIECQNTASDPNLLQIWDYGSADASFDSALEPLFSLLTPQSRFARLGPQHIHWCSAHLPRSA